MNRENIVVVGGGPVGLAFAIAAAQNAQFSVDVVEGGLPVTAPLPQAFDQRIYAVSPGSRDFLSAIGVWAHLPEARIAAVRAMQVFGDAAGAVLNLEQRAPVAWILEHGALLRALWDRVGECGAITAHAPRRPVSLVTENGAARVGLDDGSSLDAALVVGADGTQSWLRAAAGLGATEKSYRSCGVVGNFACSRSHGNVARQWFRGGEVLAWLPLPGRCISIVWSVGAERAAELLALSPDAAAAAVTQAGDASCGAFTALGPLAKFPLRRMLAQHAVAPQLALIGDAAHTIHPLAGQGVNLGFGDAAALAAALARKSPLTAAGDTAVLRKYERARGESVLALAALTDQLQRLFGIQSTAVAAARNAGLNLVESQSWVKRQLMQYAMR